MGRITSQLSGIERTLLNQLAAAQAGAAESTIRLSTLQRINSPADDPSGFVILSGLQRQLSNVTDVLDNVTTASSLVTQTQTALGQIQDQLEIIRSELEDPDSESQTKIDAAIDEINSLSATQIDGRRTLDGSADFIITNQNASQVSQVLVYATGGVSRTISGTVTTSGTQATALHTEPGGVAASASQFTLTGSLGSASITVAQNESFSDIAAAVNAVSHETGVTASAAGDNLTFTSVSAGSAQTIAVNVTSGTFSLASNTAGTSGTATINGVSYTASSTDGNRYTVNQNGFRFEIDFKSGFTGAFGSIGVSGSALSFALSTDVSNASTLAIPGMQAALLGGDSGNLAQIATGGAYSGLGANTSQAIRIVNEAIAYVTKIQGNVDGFATSSVDSASEMLTQMQEDLQTAVDEYNGVDPVEEEAQLAYYDTLIANSQASLAILYQQREGIVAMIQHIAGLD